MFRLMQLLKVVLLFCFFILPVLYFVFPQHMDLKPIIFQPASSDLTTKESSSNKRPSRVNIPDIIKYNSKTYQEALIDKLTEILNERIMKASSVVTRSDTKTACETKATLSNSCEGQCRRMEISESPRERVAQLVGSKDLQLPARVASTLEQMATKVQGGNEVLLLTAASHNHFRESQGLLQNLHQVVFPHSKRFKLVYYDIGLRSNQRRQVRAFCNCTLVDFPFDELPDFMRHLKCYAWKPVIVKAHFNQGNIVIWLDASVRFKNFKLFEDLIKQTEDRGIQMSGPSEKSPFRTARSMFHYFGDEACAYLQMNQFHATSAFFKRDFFIERAILEPWVACAVNRNCICPETIVKKVEENVEMIRKWKHEGGPVLYGLIHRYDQSAISIIVHKLFYDYYTWIFYSKLKHGISYQRKHEVPYFSSLIAAANKSSSSLFA